MAEIIAPTLNAANSADQVVAAGGTLTIYMKPATGAPPLQQGIFAVISRKTTGGDYLGIGTVSPDNNPAVLTAAGTYRVEKAVSRVAFGIEAD